MTNYVITGLLTLSLTLAVMPLTAYAKDRHDNRSSYKYHQSYRQSDKPNITYNRVFKSYDRRYDAHQSKKHTQKHTYDRRYIKQYNGHVHYYDNRHYRSGRHDDYINAYFTILGGSIVINELLHHSHDHY